MLIRRHPPPPPQTHTHTKASIKDHKQREAKGRFLGPGMGGKKLMAKWILCRGKKKKLAVNSMHFFFLFFLGGGGGGWFEWA